MPLNSRATEWLQWFMVLMVLCATVFMAVRADKPDIIFNLCTLCFGYYFGSNQSDPPTHPA